MILVTTVLKPDSRPLSCGHRDCGYTKGLAPVGVSRNEWGGISILVAPDGDEQPFGTCCEEAARDAGFYLDRARGQDLSPA